jgi:hypothetical protein
LIGFPLDIIIIPSAAGKAIGDWKVFPVLPGYVHVPFLLLLIELGWRQCIDNKVLEVPVRQAILIWLTLSDIIPIIVTISPRSESGLNLPTATVSGPNLNLGVLVLHSRNSGLIDFRTLNFYILSPAAGKYKGS